LAIFDIEVLKFLLAPFVLCLVLGGIHCYLGIHVLKRGVIFVDLSLAQVASLGATMAVFFGLDAHSTATYFVSLAATFAAAFLFTLSRQYEKLFSQEAIIGIIYALASASMVLLADHMSHGADIVKELLIGRVLWVSWEDVLKVTLIYSVVGAIHYIFRKPLIAASENPHSSAKWDVLFYCLFGVVITSSVGVAGILLVFSLLIVPSLVSLLNFTSIKGRLLFGWAFSFVICLMGMIVSYLSDLPAGATIVVCFTLVPILNILVLKVLRR